MNSKTSILLYVPNIIDYFRLILIIFAWKYINEPMIFLVLYIFQISLDFFDGYFAKKLNQISTFGAWIDVVLDNFSRGILWVHVWRFGYIISVIEWLSFSFTQKGGARWKETFDRAPLLINKLFQNNFRNPLGITAITAGLQGLPIWLYFVLNFESSATGIYFYLIQTILAYCVIGRIICLCVELWVICKNLEIILDEDSKSTQKI